MINARAESLTEKPAFKHLVGVAAVSFPLTVSMSGAKREAQGPDVGLSQELRAVRICWTVGHMAQARWEAGRVVHDHHHGA